MAELKISGRLVARNTILNLAGQAIPSLVIVFATPFLIRRLGPDRCGIMSLGLVVISFSTLFDLGFGLALRKLIAETLGKGDRARVPAITYASVIAQAISGSVGGLVLAGITPYLVEHGLQIAPALQGEARITFYLIAAAIPMMIVTDSLCGVFEAAQRFDLVNALKIPFTTSILVLPVLGVLVGWNLPGIITLELSSVALFVGLHYWLVRRLFVELDWRPQLDRVELRKLAGFGGWVMVSNVINPILTYLERLGIGRFISMSAVTSYTAPFELVTRVTGIPMSLAASLFPALSALAGQGRYRQLRQYAARAVAVLLLILVPSLLFLVLFGHLILKLWLGVTIADEGTLTLRILAVGVLANSLAMVPHVVILARGRPDLCAKFHMIELPIHAVCVWFLVRQWGAPGAALAWTLRVTLDSVLLFVATARLSREDREEEVEPIRTTQNG